MFLSPKRVRLMHSLTEHITEELYSCYLEPQQEQEADRG